MPASTGARSRQARNTRPARLVASQEQPPQRARQIGRAPFRPRRAVTPDASTGRAHASRPPHSLHCATRAVDRGACVDGRGALHGPRAIKDLTLVRSSPVASAPEPGPHDLNGGGRPAVEHSRCRRQGKQPTGRPAGDFTGVTTAADPSGGPHAASTSACRALPGVLKPLALLGLALHPGRPASVMTRFQTPRAASTTTPGSSTTPCSRASRRPRPSRSRPCTAWWRRRPVYSALGLVIRAATCPCQGGSSCKLILLRGLQVSFPSGARVFKTFWGLFGPAFGPPGPVRTLARSSGVA